MSPQEAFNMADFKIDLFEKLKSLPDNTGDALRFNSAVLTTILSKEDLSYDDLLYILIGQEADKLARESVTLQLVNTIVEELPKEEWPEAVNQYMGPFLEFVSS